MAVDVIAGIKAFNETAAKNAAKTNQRMAELGVSEYSEESQYAKGAASQAVVDNYNFVENPASATAKVAFSIAGGTAGLITNFISDAATYIDAYCKAHNSYSAD